ncbi:hypothetical protein [Clostridium intestinale]|uniref:Uncharacterized protein n=1 Tax=Clostridium intestinale TaxID=36845 RepID=A0A7D6ZJV4_9CLOT|nr:hypothetical protein [Clostridium intestinale]QLY81899.1 hypothetical protein HZF06_10030 [Clostridium intestinale]
MSFTDIKSIIGYFINDDIKITVYLSSLFLISWLYKHFKSSITEEDATNMKKLEEAINSYSNLHASIKNIINSYTSNESLTKEYLEKLRIDLSKIYTYLSIDQLKDLIELDYSCIENIKYLDDIVKKQILKLKTYQLDSISHDMESEKNIFAKFELFVKRSKFKQIVFPFMYSLFSYLAILLILIFGLNFYGASFIDKVSLAIALLYLFFGIMTLSFIINELINNRVIMNKKNFLAILFLLITPFVIFVLFSKYFIILCMICLVIYWIYFISGIIKKPI